MKFRTAVTSTILVALAVTLCVVMIVVSIGYERTARRDLSRDLVRDRAAFADMLQYRKWLHRSESRVLADEPRLKAVVSTDDVTTPTLVGVIADLRRAMRSDLLLLTDKHGVLIADATHPDDSGVSLADVPTVSTTLQAGEAEGVWIDGAQVFQVHGRRLSYGTLIVGGVFVGYRLDDALADLVGRHVGAGVVILLDSQVVATSSSAGDVPLSRERLAEALAVSVSLAQHTAQEVQLAGQRYLLSAAPLSGYAGKQNLQVVLLRSLDGAMAATRSLVRLLFGMTALSLVAALSLASWLSRRLSRPVDELVAFAQRIASGDLRPTTASGMQEVRTLGKAMNDMVIEIAAARAQITEKSRLAKELEIAERIQTSILPRDIQVAGLKLTAQMVPASEVGGDYYDVIAHQDGCWLGIGDVAGHGLSAGLVMLMVQSAFAALTRTLIAATPRQIVIALNQLIYDNVRNRLRSDEHVTFTALHYSSDGRILFAGAHEPILILRQASGLCEQVATPGTWLGVIPDISQVTADSCIQLSPGDVVVLYSDGVIECMDAMKQQLGLPRLQEEVQRCVGKSPADIHAHLMRVVRTWSAQPDDDITLLVMHHEGPQGSKEPK